MSLVYTCYVKDTSHELLGNSERAVARSRSGHTTGIGDYIKNIQECLVKDWFNTINTKDLTISLAKMDRATKQSPRVVDREAIGFSIMARNMSLVNNMLEVINRNDMLTSQDICQKSCSKLLEWVEDLL